MQRKVEKMSNSTKIITNVFASDLEVPIPRTRVRFFCYAEPIDKWCQFAIDSTDETGRSWKHPAQVDAGRYRIRFDLPEYLQLQINNVKVDQILTEFIVETESHPLIVNLHTFDHGYKIWHSNKL